VLTRLDLRGSRPAPRALRSILPRAAVDVAAALATVEPIIADVRERGVAGVRAATERLDGVAPEHFRVPAEVIATAVDTLDPDVRAALEVAIERVRITHAAQRRDDITTRVAPGGSVTERFVPIGRVGLYVPGGLAMYPSSVVMNVVPAQIAGVDAIVVTSPPQRDTGLPDERVLAACALLGVTEVYGVGGAQAVAMLAYGVEDLCEPVDLITGPGNIYVTAAKRAVRGVVAIDAEAGTTEIAVLADDTADPVHVAADLISQAEHDPSAASVLVTPSEALADAVDVELAGRCRSPSIRPDRDRAGRTAVGHRAGGRRRRRARRGRRLRGRAPGDPDARRGGGGGPGAQRRAIFRRGVFTGFPRRLLCRFQPRAAHRRVRPTQRRPIGADVPSWHSRHQLRRNALREVSHHVITLAEAEGLPAHGQAISARFGA
jgi:histidinol dehydrogenase